MNNNLLTSVQFGKELKAMVERAEIGYKRYYLLRNSYDDFFQIKISHGLFVPYDEQGNFIPEPNDDGTPYYYEKLRVYKKAKEKCLFEGFKMTQMNEYVAVGVGNGQLFGIGFKNGIYKTIEDLAGKGLILSETALKMIYKDYLDDVPDNNNSTL